jgi:LPS export ABC transporter protein LptC
LGNLLRPKQIAKALAGFGAIALAALVGMTIYVVRNRAAAPSIATIAGLLPGSLHHVHNFHWTQMKAGEQQWVLTARDANYSNDNTSIILDQPIVTMVSKDGKPVTVKAPKAVLELDGNKVKRARLSGGTQIHYGDFVMNTDVATFLPDADQVDAPGLVTIEGEGIKVTGVGMTGHTKTRQFELLKQVTTDIAPRHAVSQDSKKG